MQTHSSSVVAVKAARALEELLEREFATVEEFERALERNSSALRRANASHASLQTTQREILDRVAESEWTSVEAAKAATREVVDEVVETVETAKHEAARKARELIEDGTTLMTHDFSTTVLEAIEQAANEGDYVTVYVKESRPRYFGRKTARTLAAIDRVDVHLIVDAACGHYLPECDRVMFGMDCVVGDVLYNRVGTFPLAATANELDVPVTAVGSSAKLVGESFRFENDMRSGTEVLLEPADGFAVENPAYDATPTRLLDSVVTDKGIRQY